MSVEAQLNNGVSDGLETQVAIIGAGASGLYTAWRLVADSANANPMKGADVQVFEMDSRIGGRLWSVTMPKSEVAAELGGMRYMDSQQIAATLIEKVFTQLKPISFPMGKGNLDIYLRKQRLKADSWAKEQGKNGRLKTRYVLDAEDEGLSADQLFNRVVYDTLMADSWVRATYGHKIKKSGNEDYAFELSATDWDAIKPRLTYNFPGPYLGMRVNDMGFWNLIKDRVSQEGYQFLADAGGYYSNTTNWNAAEAFPYMVGDFAKGSTEYKTIRGGYDQILKALAAAYAKFQGAGIWTENRLERFGPSSRRGFRYALTFVNGPSGASWTVYANRIVLAMPRRSLELLDRGSLSMLGAAFDHAMASVIMEPAMKIVMTFATPWWKQLGLLHGHSITDLPLRQCYYFGTDTEDKHSVLLASYNDMDTVSFWQPLANAEEKCTAPAAAGEPDRANKAGAVMVQECVNQLQQLHGPDIEVPQPLAALYQDWAKDPFGGGYHAWKAGYEVKDTMPFMRKPNASENIHICGEAYSDQQGWIEGAFCEAEKLLQEDVGLAWPKWLDSTYYLGW